MCRGRLSGTAPFSLCTVDTHTTVVPFSALLNGGTLTVAAVLVVFCRGKPLSGGLVKLGGLVTALAKGLAVVVLLVAVKRGLFRGGLLIFDVAVVLGLGVELSSRVVRDESDKNDDIEEEVGEGLQGAGFPVDK